MEQIPISTHVVVINHSGGKLPDSNTNGAPADNFANVLSAQINAQAVNATQENQVLATPAPPAIEVTTAPEDSAAAQAIQLAEVLSGLPLPHLPSNVVVNAEALEKDLADAGLRVDAGTIPGLSAQSLATSPQPIRGEIKAVLDLDRTATSEDTSAIIAASDKALPSKQGLVFEGGETRTVALLPTQMPTAPRTESATVPTAVAPPLPLAVEIKVGTHGWDTAFSQKVAWAATNQQQVAELRLNPPNLGPIEIRITIVNDQATAQFVSAHASVRESIEAALPKLREMMGESGLTLGNVNVSSQSFQQQAGQEDEKSNSKTNFLPDLAPSSALSSLSAIAVAKNGLIDIFA